MFEELENKVASIAGAATGVDKSIAENFGKAKARVVINYRSNRHHGGTEEIKQTAAKFDGQTLVVQGDVSIEEDIKRMIETTINHFGTLDVIINDTGFENSIPTHEMSIDDWQKIIDISLTGAFVGSRGAISQSLKENKEGTIINISSVHDTIPWPNYVHYAASRGGLRLMVEAVSMEYAQYGIRVNNIFPGAVVTEHTEKKFSDPAMREETIRMVPAHEIGNAQDVANAVPFLSSGLVSCIHGTALYVDGGMTNYPAFMGSEG